MSPYFLAFVIVAHILDMLFLAAVIFFIAINNRREFDVEVQKFDTTGTTVNKSPLGISAFKGKTKGANMHFEMELYTIIKESLNLNVKYFPMMLMYFSFYWGTAFVFLMCSIYAFQHEEYILVIFLTVFIIWLVIDSFRQVYFSYRNSKS